jgi:transcription-repair coupling factor (superfamily II helicase)
MESDDVNGRAFCSRRLSACASEWTPRGWKDRRYVTLSHHLHSIRNTAALKQALQALSRGQSQTLVDMPESTRPLIAASAATHLGGRTLILTSRRDRADALYSALSEYPPAGSSLERWAAPDALPYEQLPVDIDASVQRTRIMASLLGKTDAPAVIVAPIQAMMQLIMSPAELRERSLDVRIGARMRIDSIVEWAQAVGYQNNPMVQEPGSIARRGGIVDVFPPGFEEPVRIDFFGDEIETIRHFSPHTQRSTKRLKRVLLLPPLELPTWRLREIAGRLMGLDTSSMRPEVREEWTRMVDHTAQGIVPTSLDLFAGYLVGNCTTLLDFLPSTTTVIVDEPASVRLAADQTQRQAEELERTFIESGELPAGMERPFQAAEEIFRRLSSFKTLHLGGEAGSETSALSLDAFSDPPVFGGRILDMVADLRHKLQRGWRISIATDQVDRLTEQLRDHSVDARRSAGKGEETTPLPAGMVEIVPSDLTAGWSWDRGKTAVWTDFEIFGFRKQPRRTSKRTASEGRAFAASLEPGEYVVHVDHGISKFIGLVRMESGGIEREYLQLEFQKGEKLYVPVDQSDRVTRYSSGGNVAPPLDKLGSGEWVRTKRRVRRAVREMAFELIQLYAYRDSGAGYQFPPDSKWDYELSASFPWEETRDQAAAIEAVKKDMESTHPMDRLVAGDVGFGKTEVAIRAAFKAANAGKQVAVLVPTTILALQHFQTFRQRMGAFPISIEMMSRLRSKKQQQKTIEGMKEGSVDIVIGTHRLVQKDISFKDLGLVIVDEEQRFGVRQKEFLKTIRTQVDVLSMSATPIPRTLHLSMSGIRDISLIETAPQQRLPIRTFVTPFTDSLVREVILREMDRGGQVYVVHNRVHDIDRLADHLRKIVPEARFGVGHGQMDEHVLEEVMLSFMRHEFDVLIATTIIESGVDISNVNTMIIDNADTLGLTQLYQLRGRVGRGTNRAYAYLLYQPHKSLSYEAQERLETIQEATELGAGIRVAMRDLEIRGAGNILGAEQSGHIATIGYELYMRLLSQAVEEIRSGRPALEPGPVTLDLPMTALIPDDYIQDTELRLNTYRQIAAVQTLDEVEDLADELQDRFGPFPEEIEHLLALIRLRIRATDLGIDSLVERERVIVVRPVETASLSRAALERAAGEAIRITPNSLRIRLLDLEVSWQDALDGVLTEIERARKPVAVAT